MFKELYLKNSNIPKRYLPEIELRACDEDKPTYRELKGIKENIKEFVKSGNNLLICSNHCGNGKTTWSTKLLKAYIEEVQKYSYPGDTPGLFINVSNFLNEKKLSINDSTLTEKVRNIEKNILSANLVVFDDIADKYLSEYDLNTLYYWIDYRTSNLKSCIYTSNQLPQGLEKTLGGKLYSRVVGYSDVKIFYDGDNRGGM